MFGKPENTRRCTISNLTWGVIGALVLIILGIVAILAFAPRSNIWRKIRR